MLWTCCAVTYISPAEHPRLSLLTLAFPVFLLANVMCIPAWCIIKWKRVWLPIVGILVCWSFVHHYFPLNLPSTPPKGALKVLSFNSKGYGNPAATDSDGRNAVVEYLLNTEADIICLQESGKYDYYVDIFDQKGYYSYVVNGQHLYTKLPIIDADTLHLPTRTNGGMTAKLQYGNDTILLINNHFESNHLTPELKSQYKDALHSTEADTLRKDLRPVVGVLTEAAPYRALQTDSIAAIIEQWLPRPVILCGDFNDTPVSYTHRVLTRHLDSAYSESASGVGFTFHERGFPVRIDHILYSPASFRSYGTYVDHTMSYSDHYPIITFLALQH